MRIFKNRRIMVITLTFVVIILAYVIFISFSSNQAWDPNEGVPDKKDVSEINFNILDNESLNDFHSWTSIPIEVGPSGKTNPFAQ